MAGDQRRSAGNQQGAIPYAKRGLLCPATALAALFATIAAARAVEETRLLGGVAALPVAEEIRVGYDRDKLYPHWKDLDKNGCNADRDVLFNEAIESPAGQVG